MRSIDDNLQAVRERIAQAAAGAGRAPGSVTLVAVSKTHGAAMVAAALAAGQRAFGENYVQEAVDKMDRLRPEPDAQAIDWHLVGPLQSNKARVAAARFSWVHTVQSEKIARRLSEARADAQPALNVLLQVNVSGESSKGGVTPGELPQLAAAVAALPRLRLRGLMTVPEPTSDVSLQRARFRQLRELLTALPQEADTLSMGMSDDLEAAIAEGATMVRIGTAIFGARQAVRPAA